MSPRYYQNDELGTNPRSHPRPQKSSHPRLQKSKSTSVPYPSPPNSPRETTSPLPEAPKVSEDEARAFRTGSLAPPSPPTMPPQHPLASPAQVEPEEDEDAVSELKTRLGLDGWCGGLKKKSAGFCRQRPPAANKARIVSQLGAMTDLTQSSPGLDAALDTLASLVHCRFHDGGASKKARIDTWRTKFPVGEADTDLTALVEKQIRKLLDLVSTQCIEGAFSTQPRCECTIGGQRVQNCAATIAEIVRPDVYLNDAYLEGLLKVLETNMFCHSHNNQPLQMVERWKSEIGKIRGKQQAKSVGGDAPERMVGPSRPSSSQSTERPPTKTEDGSALQSGGLSIPSFPLDLSTYWPTAYDTSPFEIIAKSTGPADLRSSYSRVKKKMKKELELVDLRSGYVYAYEVPGNSGYVKIGYTSRSVGARHAEWEFECNRLPKVLYPTPSGAIAVVSNARRVEALCHEELDHRRIRIYCQGCLKQHVEWFEVSAAEAVAVIQKWSRWMATNPYQSIELRSGVKRTIREEERKRTLDMDRFMREISEVVGPTMDSGLKVDDVKVEVVQMSILSTDSGGDSPSPS
jgi:hypothetical protein